MLGGVPEFRTIIAIAGPDGEISLAYGEIFGIIRCCIRGINGFGHDPLFYIPKYGKIFAEISSEIKNSVSHRAKALQKAREIIKELTGK
jgi:XTP/dITP diphosphohydrolase